MFISHAEFAELSVATLGRTFSRATWGRLCREGLIKARRVGRHWFADRDDALRYLRGEPNAASAAGVAA